MTSKINNDPNQIREWYDKVAPEYGKRNFEELEHKPFDREILERFAALTKGTGQVCDLGCGPGEITNFLNKQGCQISGMDFSAAMVQEARRLSPHLTFEQGDMFALDIEGGALAGIVAFYAFVHYTPEKLDDLLKEWNRALMPGGYLLMAFHIGEEIIHLPEFMGAKIPIDFIFFDIDDVLRRTQKTGLKVTEAIIRYPYRDVEYASKRAYIIAKK